MGLSFHEESHKFGLIDFFSLVNSITYMCVHHSTLEVASDLWLVLVTVFWNVILPLAVCLQAIFHFNSHVYMHSS